MASASEPKKIFWGLIRGPKGRGTHRASSGSEMRVVERSETRRKRENKAKIRENKRKKGKKGGFFGKFNDFLDLQ